MNFRMTRYCFTDENLYSIHSDAKELTTRISVFIYFGSRQLHGTCMQILVRRTVVIYCSLTKLHFATYDIFGAATSRHIRV
jgi:hypothetical protein